MSNVEESDIPVGPNSTFDIQQSTFDISRFQNLVRAGRMSRPHPSLPFSPRPATFRSRLDAARPRHSARYLLTLSIGALGVVYGDIGTSPLYALRECFHPAHGVHISPQNILGILSLIFWSLVIVISIKYLVFVMRADNRGEGGILALMSLAGARGGGKVRFLLV